jgi:hypothetical protein
MEQGQPPASSTSPPGKLSTPPMATPRIPRRPPQDRSSLRRLRGFLEDLILLTVTGAGKDTLNGITRKIAAFRNKLDGVTTVDDYGIAQTTAPAMVALQGTSATYPAQTIVDASPTTSLAFSRTPAQVLQVVTGVTNTPHKGVFFPNGLNGNIV